jgi:hypothetical protein
MNFEGESCPNGATGDSCLCSSKASNDRFRRERAAVEAALKYAEPSRLYIYVFVLSCASVLAKYILIDPAPLRVMPFVGCFLVAFFVKMWRDDARESQEREELRKQEYLEMRCAIHLLLSEHRVLSIAIPVDPYPHMTAARKAALEKAKVDERTVRNREVKRRAKLRKAEAAEIQRKERSMQLLESVAESQTYERTLRDQMAAQYGWPIHPNDVEDLMPDQQAVMLEAWRLRLPPPDFLTGS